MKLSVTRQVIIFVKDAHSLYGCKRKCGYLCTEVFPPDEFLASGVHDSKCFTCHFREVQPGIRAAGCGDLILDVVDHVIGCFSSVQFSCHVDPLLSYFIINK